MAQYYIGIDGGGTGSRLAAIDMNNKIIGRAVGGSTNIAAVGYDAVFANIKKLFKELAAAGVSLQDCQGICIGSAGASTGNNAALLAEIFRNIGYTGKIKVMNDAELVLTAETGGKPGVIIISGTGSVGYAINKDGATIRAGGWGHMIDDGGSGYRIGMDAIKAALMGFDDRGEKTMLTKMVAEFFCTPENDIQLVRKSDQLNKVAEPHCLLDRLSNITGYVYGSNFAKAKVAEIAMLVENAANQMDEVAIAIERHAAAELVNLARTLTIKAQLDNDEYKLVLNGSVILHNKNIRSIFEKEICSIFPKVRIVEISQSAEMSAAFLARG